MIKYHSTDNGNCRVNYTVKNSKQQTLQYCAYIEKLPDTVIFMRCSQDFEPSHQCYPNITPELSPGTESTDVAVNKWIKSNWNN